MPVVVFFYVSGHGFGHSIRQIAILNALLRTAAAGVKVVVRTAAPEWLFRRTVDGPWTMIPGETDPGVWQIDGLRLDERATIERASAFYRELPARVEAEAAILRGHGAHLVVSDAPPLACAAARAAGIPSVVCANFTWDWIYREYLPAGRHDNTDLLSTIGRAYAQASAAWRMPMHGGFGSIRTVVDIPFVARHARASPADVRRALNLPLDSPLALVSFGGYGATELPLDRLDCTGRWSVVLTAPAAEVGSVPRGIEVVAEELMYAAGLKYEDLVRAADAVVTKPGYGIVSDCVANRTAVLYTSRGRFAEYDVLVREMPRFLRCRFISLEDLLAGRWRAALDALSHAPSPPENPKTDGAELVARMIVEQTGGATLRR